ncbi:MAG: CGGC domain-containing protein [Spirochaetia bacterium]
MKYHEGAFERYADFEVELVGYTTCDGCPGANIEYAVEEMKKNGATVIHLATGLVVGYPPCPYITHFRNFSEQRYKLEVVYGTHPIPEKYRTMHTKLGTWEGDEWKLIISPTMSDEPTRLAYN